jgi:hypothetical protein
MYAPRDYTRALQMLRMSEQPGLAGPLLSKPAWTRSCCRALGAGWRAHLLLHSISLRAAPCRRTCHALPGPPLVARSRAAQTTQTPIEQMAGGRAKFERGRDRLEAMRQYTQEGAARCRHGQVRGIASRGLKVWGSGLGLWGAGCRSWRHDRCCVSSVPAQETTRTLAGVSSRARCLTSKQPPMIAQRDAISAAAKGD